MVEQQPSKLNTRVRFPSPAFLEDRLGPEDRRGLTSQCEIELIAVRFQNWMVKCCCSSVVEHFLGKEEVMGSSPISSSVDTGLVC